MGCNCKKKVQKLNNLDNEEMINQAKLTYDSLIEKGWENFDLLDLENIQQTYNLLYPASTAVLTWTEKLEQIKIGIEIYDVKRRKK